MRIAIKSYVISFLLHLSFFTVSPFIFNWFYKNEKILRSSKVGEINLTLLEKGETSQPLGERKEKGKKVQQHKRQPVQSMPQVYEGFPQAYPQKQHNQTTYTRNSVQGKDEKEGKQSTGLSTEVFQSSSKRTEEDLSTKNPFSTSSGQTDTVQKELFLKEKLLVISSLVQKSINYPTLARRMGWEGRVVVYFKLTPEGRLEDLHVLESSGYEVLDGSALEAVRKIAHLFPKPPVMVVVKLPVNFKLE